MGDKNFIFMCSGLPFIQVYVDMLESFYYCSRNLFDSLLQLCIVKGGVEGVMYQTSLVKRMKYVVAGILCDLSLNM